MPVGLVLIVLVLMVILAGSIAATVVLWILDATWWQIALGYVGGGWAGLLLGLPCILAGRWLWRAATKRPEQGRAGASPRAQHPVRYRSNR